MIVLLLGKLKDDTSVPILIALLEDEEVRLASNLCIRGNINAKVFAAILSDLKMIRIPDGANMLEQHWKKLDNAIG